MEHKTEERGLTVKGEAISKEVARSNKQKEMKGKKNRLRAKKLIDECAVLSRHTKTHT